MNGGRFDFDDGGSYCGGWEDGKAHGHGVCTGPKGQGEYAGAWHYGFEVSGVYTWPSGNTYKGQWQNGKRHGLGVERRGRWIYKGEWTQGYKGRYGVRQSANSLAKYEGTWANGLQDGYGTEVYADGEKKDTNRGGFVLRAHSEAPSRRRSLSERSILVKKTILQTLRIKKQRSTGDIVQKVTSGTGSIRSSCSTTSCCSDESVVTGYSGGHDQDSFLNVEFIDANVTETYVGEWKNDKRSGFGVSERSDGLKYEGEWYNNKKFGYGITTFKDGTKEEGKYKNNILLTSQRKRHLLFVRSSKLRERVDAAVVSATRAAQIAMQKSDIAMARKITAGDRAEQADLSVVQAQEDCDIARICAKQFAPDFHQPGVDIMDKLRANEAMPPPELMIYQKGDQKPLPSMQQLPPQPFINSAPAPQSLAATATMPNAVEVGVGVGGGPEQQPFAMATDLSTIQRVLPQRLSPAEHAAVPVPFSAMLSQSFGPNPPLSSATSAVPTQPPEIALMNAVGPTSVTDATAKVPKRLMPLLAGQAAKPEVQTFVSWDSTAGGQMMPLAGPMPTTVIADGGTMTTCPPHSMFRPPPAVSISTAPISSAFQSNLKPDDRQRTPVNRPMTLAQQQRYPATATMEARPTASVITPPSRRNNSLLPTDDKPHRGSSKYSLNQIMNDHFDQYAETNSSQRFGGDAGGDRRRHDMTCDRNDSSMRTEAVDDNPTFSSMYRPMHLYPNEPASDLLVRRHTRVNLDSADRFHNNEARSSLPDLMELDKTPLIMTREEIAHLSSQRRLEILRKREEEDMYKRNPLLLFRLIFHPNVRAWIARWKLMLFVCLMNLGLFIIFYHLLSSSRPNRQRKEDG